MHQYVGRLEQAGNIVATAQPVDIVSQSGSLGELLEQPIAVRAVASQCQVPVGPVAR